MNSSPARGAIYREQLDEMYAWCEALCTGDAGYTEDEMGEA
jgi:hypothetical protein